jgi:hypothetical protein
LLREGSADIMTAHYSRVYPTCTESANLFIFFLVSSKVYPAVFAGILSFEGFAVAKWLIVVTMLKANP